MSGITRAQEPLNLVAVAGALFISNYEVINGERGLLE